jgi:hypothetical protein
MLLIASMIGSNELMVNSNFYVVMTTAKPGLPSPLLLQLIF